MRSALHTRPASQLHNRPKCQSQACRKKRRPVTFGAKRPIQYTMLKAGLAGKVSTDSTANPKADARARNAASVHQVRWCGGPLIVKFGISVIAEGQLGTASISPPPGRRQRIISVINCAGSGMCSRT